MVTDSSTNRPLAGVQVSVAGARLGAATDAAGRYSINRVAAATHVIDARRLGFRQLSHAGVIVTADSVTTVDLRLASVPLTLEAVVSTGVVDPIGGTRVPFTVGHIDAENAPVPATNAVETIQGKIAGVTVVPNGRPGTGTNIVLRSPTSINKSNTPLIVVDGVILSQSFDASSADLESLDIESVEVVKGAAAASLYGSCASACVIQIRTKREVLGAVKARPLSSCPVMLTVTVAISPVTFSLTSVARAFAACMDRARSARTLPARTRAPPVVSATMRSSIGSRLPADKPLSASTISFPGDFAPRLKLDAPEPPEPLESFEPHAQSSSMIAVALVAVRITLYIANLRSGWFRSVNRPGFIGGSVI